MGFTEENAKEIVKIEVKLEDGRIEFYFETHPRLVAEWHLVHHFPQGIIYLKQRIVSAIIKPHKN